MKKFLLLTLILSLIACAPKFEGTYANGNGQLYFTFKSDGMVTTNFSMTGKESAGQYKKEGNKIAIRFPNDKGEGKEVVWELNESGSISTGGLLGVLTKK